MSDLLQDLLDKARSDKEVEIKETNKHLQSTLLTMLVILAMATASLAGWIIGNAYFFAVTTIALSIINTFVGTTYLSLKSRRRMLITRRDA